MTSIGLRTFNRTAHRAVHRQLVTVTVLVPSGFSYLINRTKLFKRQEGDNELNDRKTWMDATTAQPTAMTIEA